MSIWCHQVRKQDTSKYCMNGQKWSKNDFRKCISFGEPLKWAKNRNNHS